MSEKTKIEKTKEPNYPMRRLVVGLGLAATLGTGAKLLTEGNSSRSSDGEVSVIKDTAVNPEKRALSLKNGALIFRGGVKVRNTPEITRDQYLQHQDDKNLAFSIGKNKALVFQDPIVYEGEDGNIWVGATREDADNEPEGSKQVADKTIWVCLSLVEGQRDGQGNPFVEEIAPKSSHIYEDSTNLVEVTDDGEYSSNGHRVAIASGIMPESSAEEYINSTKA